MRRKRGEGRWQRNWRKGEKGETGRKRRVRVVDRVVSWAGRVAGSEWNV